MTYVREVKMDYQYSLIGNTVLVVTAEANYSKVFEHEYPTPTDAISAYTRIKFAVEGGVSIYEACNIQTDQVSAYVQNWEAKRLARYH